MLCVLPALVPLWSISLFWIVIEPVASARTKDAVLVVVQMDVVEQQRALVVAHAGTITVRNGDP